MASTKEQDVIQAKAKISKLKEKFLTALREYVANGQNGPQRAIDLLLECQKRANEYFNFAEEFVGNSDLLGAHKSSLWAQGFAEDCAEILNTMPGHFKLLLEGFKNSNFQDSVHILPGATSYANMQRMVVKYLSESVANSIKDSFESSNLPVYGFQNEAKEFMTKRFQVILAFVFGTIFVAVLLAICFIAPNPSTFQYTVFKTVLALAGAAVAAVIPGFIEVQVANWVRAGGAIAVFVILYFWNPAFIKPEEMNSPKPGVQENEKKEVGNDLNQNDIKGPTPEGLEKEIKEKIRESLVGTGTYKKPIKVEFNSQ
jgi:hypothetical protein